MTSPVVSRLMEEFVTAVGQFTVAAGGRYTVPTSSLSRLEHSLGSLDGLDTDALREAGHKATGGHRAGRGQVPGVGPVIEFGSGIAEGIFSRFFQREEQGYEEERERATTLDEQMRHCCDAVDSIADDSQTSLREIFLAAVPVLQVLTLLLSRSPWGAVASAIITAASYLIEQTMDTAEATCTDRDEAIRRCFDTYLEYCEEHCAAEENDPPAPAPDPEEDRDPVTEPQPPLPEPEPGPEREPARDPAPDPASGPAPGPRPGPTPPPPAPDEPGYSSGAHSIAPENIAETGPVMAPAGTPITGPETVEEQVNAAKPPSASAPVNPPTQHPAPLGPEHSSLEHPRVEQQVNAAKIPTVPTAQAPPMVEQPNSEPPATSEPPVPPVPPVSPEPPAVPKAPDVPDVPDAPEAPPIPERTAATSAEGAVYLTTIDTIIVEAAAAASAATEFSLDGSAGPTAVEAVAADLEQNMRQAVDSVPPEAYLGVLGLVGVGLALVGWEACLGSLESVADLCDFPEEEPAPQALPAEPEAEPAPPVAPAQVVDPPPPAPAPAPGEVIPPPPELAEVTEPPAPPKKDGGPVPDFAAGPTAADPGGAPPGDSLPPAADTATETATTETPSPPPANPHQSVPTTNTDIPDGENNEPAQSLGEERTRKAGTW